MYLLSKRYVGSQSNRGGFTMNYFKMFLDCLRDIFTTEFYPYYFGSYPNGFWGKI